MTQASVSPLEQTAASVPSEASIQVWSATPTPFTEALRLDHAALERTIDSHDRMSVDGLFLAGTCGEGPWMPMEQTRELVATAVRMNQGRMKLAVQVTENSPARVLERIEGICSEGIDYVVVAQPSMFMNATPGRVAAFYREIFDRTNRPVCFYDRGSRPDFPITPELLAEIYAHPAVRMVKDSSTNAEHRAIALAARAKRPELTLLNGDEFACPTYMQAGYNGFMTGGAVLSAPYLRAYIKAHLDGENELAARIDRDGIDLLYALYGGPTIACWLTGLKYALVQLGLFGTTAGYLTYEMNDEQRAAIDRALAGRLTA